MPQTNIIPSQSNIIEALLFLLTNTIAALESAFDIIVIHHRILKRIDHERA
jgi:hypothetical protein